MRKSGAILCCTGFFLLIQSSHSAWATDVADPRAFIEQAIAAQGGIKNFETIGARYTTVKGNLYELENATFRSSIESFPPDYDRETVRVETIGVLVEMTTVVAANRGWEVTKDQSNDHPELLGNSLLDRQLQMYVGYVATLLPVLRESGFTLSVEASQKVNDSLADVVLVRKKDKPDVRFFFDKQSHFLVKIRHEQIYLHESKPGGKDVWKSGVFEYFLSDYRLIDALEAERKMLADANIPADVGSLKTLLRSQSLDASEQARVQKQIKALGDDKFNIREDAKTSLIKMGPRVVPMLDEATRSADPEVASSARECLQKLGKGPSRELLAAAIRVYANAHDPEALDVFLAYLPAAGDDLIGKELRGVILLLAASDARLKERVLAAARGDNANLKKALVSLVNATGVNFDIGYRVYPVGLKSSMKAQRLRDGKKTADWEVTEMRFYHSLPASMFTKP